MAKTYRVNEIFYSLQGEGHHTGRAAVFVRFSGCNRRCAFCDTDFASFVEMTAADILAVVNRYTSQHVILTGGEPALQVDDELVGALKSCGKYIQIETNGSLPVPDGIDWITCSPKEPPYGIERIDELKIVFEGGGRKIEGLREYYGVEACYLQPRSGENTAETVAYILDHPWWRLSLQTHKLIDIK